MDEYVRVERLQQTVSRLQSHGTNRMQVNFMNVCGIIVVGIVMYVLCRRCRFQDYNRPTLI